MPETITIREVPAIILDDMVISKTRYSIIGTDNNGEEHTLGCFFSKEIAEQGIGDRKLDLERGYTIAAMAEVYRKFFDISAGG